MMTRITASAFVALAILTGCADPYETTYHSAPAEVAPTPPPARSGFDPGATSLRLDEDLSSDQVHQRLGYLPDHTDQMVCGQSIGKLWDCRVEVYYNRGQALE